METFVEVDALKKALTQLLPLARGARTPAAKTVKMVAEDNKLTLTATDTEVYATRTIQAETRESGVLCVNASTFQQFVSTLNVPDITLTAEGFNLSIDGENVNAKVSGIDTDDFPAMNETGDLRRFFDINTRLFFHHVDQVIDAVAVNDGRHQLEGVYLHDYDGHVYMVATDGHRLAREPIMDSVTENVNLIIPQRAAMYANKLFSEEPSLTLYFNDTTLVFEGESTKLVARLIEGNYPNYNAIVPKTFATQIAANKDNLRSALQSAMVFAQGDFPEVVFAYSEDAQTLTVKGRRNQDSDGESNVTLEVEASGGSITVHLTGRFVLVALDHIDQETISIGMNASDKAVVFAEKLDGSTYYHMVSPLVSK